MAFPLAALAAPIVKKIAMQAAMKAPGKLLGYCRTGTRSTMLWALAATREGLPVDDAVEAAAAAGYDLSGFRARLA